MLTRLTSEDLAVILKDDNPLHYQSYDGKERPEIYIWKRIVLDLLAVFQDEDREFDKGGFLDDCGFNDDDEEIAGSSATLQVPGGPITVPL